MPAYYITGDDESLLLTAIGDLVKTLVGDGDRTLMVDDFDGDEYEVRAVVDAAQTPPFLTESRVVVARCRSLSPSSTTARRPTATRCR